MLPSGNEFGLPRVLAIALSPVPAFPSRNSKPVGASLEPAPKTGFEAGPMPCPFATIELPLHDEPVRNVSASFVELNAVLLGQEERGNASDLLPGFTCMAGRFALSEPSC